MFVPQRVEDAVAILVHEARDVVVHLARVVRNPELVGGARGAVEAVILGECVLELGVKEGRRTDPWKKKRREWLTLQEQPGGMKEEASSSYSTWE